MSSIVGRDLRGIWQFLRRRRKRERERATHKARAHHSRPLSPSSTTSESLTLLGRIPMQKQKFLRLRYKNKLQISALTGELVNRERESGYYSLIFILLASLRFQTTHWNNCKKMTAPESRLTEPAKALKKVPGALSSLADRM